MPVFLFPATLYHLIQLAVHTYNLDLPLFEHSGSEFFVTEKTIVSFSRSVQPANNYNLLYGIVLNKCSCLMTCAPITF